MEKILHLYNLPYDAKRPVICFDERPCQLLKDVFMPIPMKLGKVKKEDYNYQRNGTCSILVAFEPLTGQRYLEVRKTRTKNDYAKFMKALSDRYPDAEKIVLIQDNLNTHCGGSFYKEYPPEQAFALAQRFEMHFTPVHASWLNMVEIELSVLSKQCLDRRIGTIEELEREATTWAQRRNNINAKIKWSFTKNDARDRFKKHYSISKD